MSGKEDIGSNDSIRFILDGEVITLTGVDPTRTVLQYLREDLGRTGTKEGCAEGDCGACMVVLVEVDRSGSRLQVRAVNSCIQFLPTLDGRELITIESLRGAKDQSLHPAQKAMLECHGSQCGFCTPGFVMSLFAQYKNSSSPTRRETDDTLAGNLCRCTGYRPIIDAAQKMHAFGGTKDDDWLRIAGSCQSKPGAAEKKKVAALKALDNGKSLSVTGGDHQFHAPTSISGLAELLERFPEATILAGGTDVGLWVTKQQRPLPVVISTGKVHSLADISIEDETIDIGAAATFSDVIPVLDEHFPQLHDLFTRFASLPIRNVATVGGNIANGSPIGDSMPALLVLDASLVLRKGSVTRIVPLNEFYLGYQKNALATGEFVERIRLPRLAGDTVVRSFKISKRFDQDISAVCGAYFLRHDGATIGDLRIAYGGLATTPKRARSTEKLLAGAQWNEMSVRSAMKQLASDFQPISDMRASADYRLRVCQNLLYRFWLETGDQPVATDVYNYGR
jgi:xanthine dehydrogenase small subunit